MKFLTVSFLLLLSISVVKAGTKVKLGFLLFPPNVMLDYESNECVGRNITITRALLAEYDISVQAICSSPLRIYPMVVNGDVDFTINIKSTESLTGHVGFSDIPFSKITLNLYRRVKPLQTKSISAVKGYNYQGYRQKFIQEGFEFIDLPSSISALQMFLKENTDYLVSYESPVQNYMRKQNLSMDSSVSITQLQEIDTYYAVASRSPHYNQLMQVFSDFAAKNQVQYLQSAFP